MYIRDYERRYYSSVTRIDIDTTTRGIVVHIGFNVMIPETDFICKGSGGFGREPLVVPCFPRGGCRIDFVARRGTWWHLPSKTPREMVIFFIFLHLSWEVLTFLLPRPPGDSRVPWVPLGASWVPPGCLLGAFRMMKINENLWNSMKIN